VNRIGVRLTAAMALIAIVSLLAVPIATTVAERAAYRRLPEGLRERVERFSRPAPILPMMRDREARPTIRDGRTMPMMGTSPAFEGEAATLLLLVRDLRELRRDAVVAGVLVALAASVGLAWALSRELARPIEAVSRAASEMAAGRLDARARIPHPGRQPREVRELAHDFDAMAASLERLEGERTSMVADIAHELRNPLATLSLRLEAAADGLLDVSAEEAGTLLAQTNLLTRLVDDLRTLSLAEAGRLRLSYATVDLRRPLRDAASAHGTAADRSGVRLVVDVPPEPLVVRADPDRLLQIVHNLLDNAIRISPDLGEVRLTAARVGRRVRVTVEDDGPGIAVDPPEAIFERFVRDRRRDTRGESSGLGLAIVRTLVSLHGGTVFAHRRAPVTRIGFELPAAGDPEAMWPDAARSEPARPEAG